MKSASAARETSLGIPSSTEVVPEAGAVEERQLVRSKSVDESINILIVDDEPKNLVVLETVLNDPAYRLVKAESADHALLALLVDQFALLILDIRMPGTSGIQLAHMIKQRRKTSQIPIIFLTAYYNEDQHVLEGYGAGAVDYLQKPVNPDILRSKVAVFAELYRMQREVGFSNQALLAEVAERRRAQDQLRDLNQTLEHRVIERTLALRTSAALLQAVTDNASVGLATLDQSFGLTFANPAFCQIFGIEGASDAPPCMQLGPVLKERVSLVWEQVLAGERRQFELSLSSGGGKRPGYYSIFCEPERDPQGSVAGVVLVVIDMTERKDAEEQIRLLLREVNHRSKNLLGVVSAIARQTRAATQEEFVARFSERIQALAASHDLLAKSEWQSIELSELLRVQLAHFQGLIGQRVSFNGPELNVSAAAAQSMGMIVHELATNAAKHGALSNEVGTVVISWRMDECASGSQFNMSWVEHGGPPVARPSHRGYGSTVIKTMAELSLAAKAEVEFAPSGLMWKLTCPAGKLCLGQETD